MELIKRTVDNLPPSREWEILTGCMHTATNCCDICTWGKIPYPRLDVLQCVSRGPRTNKCCQLREVDNHMKEQLKKVEREKIIQENLG